MSEWLTAREAAAHVKAPSVKAFNRWVMSRGVPSEGRRGRARLFMAGTLDKVLRNDARPPMRVTRRA